MSSTVFLGNLPTWVTADDVKQWLVADNLVADSVKVIRNPETQESKGFAFIEAPNDEEMNLIIRRFDRAPVEPLEHVQHRTVLIVEQPARDVHPEVG